MDTARSVEQGSETSEGEPGEGGEPEGLSGSGWNRGGSTVDIQAYISVALMILIGSFTAAAAKVAVRDLPVAIVPIARFGVAGLCLIPLVWGKGTFQKLVREDSWLLILAAALFVPINQGFFLNASRFAPTTHIAIFYATVPLIVLILSCVLGYERFHRDRLWGMMASIAGVAVIALGSLWNSDPSSVQPTKAVVPTALVLWGDLLLIGAVASWGAYVTFSKPLVARHGVVPVLVGTFLIGTLLDVPIALATHSGWRGLASASSASWIAMALLAFVITPLGQLFQNFSLRRLEASRVATFSNGSPVLTVVWGVWFFEEALTVAVAIGGILTLVGIVWSTRLKSGRTAQVTGSSNTDSMREPRLDSTPRPREPLSGLTVVQPCHSA